LPVAKCWLQGAGYWVPMLASSYKMPICPVIDFSGNMQPATD